jgi:hypothetical protein
MKRIFQNKKIRITGLAIMLVSMISIGIFMQSCNNADDNLSVTTIDSQKANIIASKYLELVGDQYRLNLSEKEAIALGISKFDYNRMWEEIRQANIFIESAKKTPNMSISLTNPQEIKSERIRLKDGNEIGNGMQQRGSVSPLPSPGSSASLSIPNGITTVKFSFSGSALINTASLTINTGYGTQYISFVSSLSFSDDETANVPATPAVWLMTAVLYQGNGTITFYY